MQKVSAVIIPQASPDDVALLKKILSKGHSAAVHQGRLVVSSTITCPDLAHQVSVRRDQLLSACMQCTGKDAFYFQSFTTGAYGDHKSGGVTLQFLSAGGESAYVIFNADLCYLRGPKVGQRLPRRQFRVGPRSHFYKFWVRSGIELPKRLQNFHESMGKLRRIAFAGVRNRERFDSGSLAPIRVSEADLRAVLTPDKYPTSVRQIPDQNQTSFPDKECLQSHGWCASQPISSTGLPNHGNKDVREYGYEGSDPPESIPQTQTVDEWLEEYDFRDQLNTSTDFEPPF